MPEKRIQLTSCVLVIRDGVDPVDMLINADRILRGLPALTREKQQELTALQSASALGQIDQPLNTFDLIP